MDISAHLYKEKMKEADKLIQKSDYYIRPDGLKRPIVYKETFNEGARDDIGCLRDNISAMIGKFELLEEGLNKDSSRKENYQGKMKELRESREDLQGLKEHLDYFHFI